MSAKKIVGIIVILIGLFYLAAPHSIHVSSRVGFGLEHMYHMVIGVVLIIIGLVIIFLGRGKKAPAQTKLSK